MVYTDLCSFYFSVFDEHAVDMTLEEFVKLLRGERWKVQVEEYQRLKASGRETEAKKLKRKLAALVIAGRCDGSHAETNLKQWSGDAMLDVDKCNGRVSEFLQVLKDTPWVKAAWRSVSYDGLKLVVRVEAESVDEYRLAYALVAWHVAQLLAFPCDMSCKNPTRPCFASYDPEAFFRPAIERLARVPAEVDIASEFRYRDPILDPDDLVIIISQSGETSDTLAALRLAKSRGVPVLAVVNVVGSSIARAADYVLYTYAGPEIAVASTKAYMVQLCTLYLFAFRLAYARGRLSEAETRRLTAELLRAGEVIQPRLADCEQIKYLASRFVNTQSCFFIGRGFDYALSLEGSLKLKEISYVHSDAYAAGELKHGTISLITDGVPVIALATQKQVYEKTISNAKETRSRGARVLLFTTKDAEVPEGVATEVIRLDEYDDILMPLQLIVPLQLFAYYMAVLRGCDVDKPRNLAKSVTVE